MSTILSIINAAPPAAIPEAIIGADAPKNIDALILSNLVKTPSFLKELNELIFLIVFSISLSLASI